MVYIFFDTKHKNFLIIFHKEDGGEIGCSSFFSDLREADEALAHSGKISLEILESIKESPNFVCIYEKANLDNLSNFSKDLPEYFI